MIPGIPERYDSKHFGRSEQGFWWGVYHSRPEPRRFSLNTARAILAYEAKCRCHIDEDACPVHAGNTRTLTCVQCGSDIFCIPGTQCFHCACGVMEWKPE